MSGGMSDSVSVFQSQVASVLEVLFNVAVVEITKLFEDGRVVSEGSGVSGAKTNPTTPLLVQDELRTRAESALGNLRKNIHSVGVQARDGEQWRSDGKQAFLAAEGGAGFWEGGGHMSTSRTEVVNVEALPSIAVECKLAGTAQRKSPPSAAAPPADRSGTGGVGVATGPVDSRAEGPAEGGNPLSKRKSSKKLSFSQHTPGGGEQVAQSTPGHEEQETQSTPAEEGGVTQPTPVKEGGVTQPTPVKVGGVTQSTPVQKEQVTESTPVEEGGVTQPSPVKVGGVTQPIPVKKEQVTESMLVEEGGFTQPIPVKMEEVTEFTPAEEGVVTQSTPVKTEQVTESTPAEEGGVTQPIPVKDGRKRGTKQAALQFDSQRCKAPRVEQQKELSPELAPPLMVPSPPACVGRAGACVGGEAKLLRPCSVRLVNVLLVFRGAGRGHSGRGRKGAGAALPKELRPHQRLHTGKRPCCFTECGDGVWRLQSRAHACQLCGKKFKRRKVLKRHQRFHTGEKPYSCTHCRRAFALRKNLRRHERFHTGERPHCCSHCGKKFRLRESLRSHLRFHTGERPFACTLCSKRFRVPRNLKRHLAIHKAVGPPPPHVDQGPEKP